MPMHSYVCQMRRPMRMITNGYGVRHCLKMENSAEAEDYNKRILADLQWADQMGFVAIQGVITMQFGPMLQRSIQRVSMLH